MDFSFEQTHILENERARLVPMTLDHYNDLIGIALANPDLLQYSPKTINTKVELEKYLANAVAARTKQTRYPWVIKDKITNKIVGSTSYGNVSNFDQRLEIGWTWISREAQRTGLNRQCKLLLLAYAFDQLNFERVELKTDARNQQSRTAIEKLGAQYEGELRSHTLMSDGYRRSTVYYSILRPEWPAIKAQLSS